MIQKSAGRAHAFVPSNISWIKRRRRLTWPGFQSCGYSCALVIRRGPSETAIPTGSKSGGDHQASEEAISFGPNCEPTNATLSPRTLSDQATAKRSANSEQARAEKQQAAWLWSQNASVNTLYFALVVDVEGDLSGSKSSQGVRFDVS